MLLVICLFGFFKSSLFSPIDINVIDNVSNFFSIIAIIIIIVHRFSGKVDTILLGWTPIYKIFVKIIVILTYLCILPCVALHRYVY